VWWFVDSTVADARFLSPEDKLKAIERLRANNTGIGNNEFKWSHVFEVFYDIKSLWFVGIALCVNAGTAVTSAFGPTLINNFGFDKYVGIGVGVGVGVGAGVGVGVGIGLGVRESLPPNFWDPR
jgi:hypothetical protein